LLKSCADPGIDDGLDPRYDRRAAPAKVANRKALQLCGQVADTLALLLAGDTADDVLRDLQVVSVRPAPNSSRLLVTVSPCVPDADLDEMRQALARAQGRLRAEMASAIHRRRVPELTFLVVSWS
jgi:ribosome-binding factor A